MIKSSNRLLNVKTGMIYSLEKVYPSMVWKQGWRVIFKNDLYFTYWELDKPQELYILISKEFGKKVVQPRYDEHFGLFFEEVENLDLMQKLHIAT